LWLLNLKLRMISRTLLRIKAMHVAFSYHNNPCEDLTFYENELQKSLDRYYDLYIAFFTILFTIQRHAVDITEIRRRKFTATPEERNPNMRFINNRVINDLMKNKEIESASRFNPIIWEEYPEIIRKIYNSLVETDVYKDYMENPMDSYSNDKQIVYYIYEILLPENIDIFSVLEDKSIFWNDDVEFVLSMNHRTIQRMKESKSANNKLMPMYKTHDDEVFVKKLLQKALLQANQYDKLIAGILNNWELERMAIIDRVILHLAITEFLEFESIPLPVTMDEYIEIAKYYSTEKSPTFINGLLERIVDQLQRDNKISKLKSTKKKIERS